MGELLKHIQSERAQKKTKRSFERTLFSRINALVTAYALDESFLRRLDDIADRLLAESPDLDGARVKECFGPPLFSLSTEAEYRVTLAILDRVNNPYLHFAHSPDEILLSGPLFRHNPSLGPDKLARDHFETLLLDELVSAGVTVPARFEKG